MRLGGLHIGIVRIINPNLLQDNTRPLYYQRGASKAHNMFSFYYFLLKYFEIDFTIYQ